MGVTKIRSHKEAEPKTCKKILGYDANALYLSTMLTEMPCGQSIVRHYSNHEDLREAVFLTERVKKETWFGFAEVDIEIPQNLWPKFEEMCPFFYNKKVSEEVVPQHMLDYLKHTGRKRGDGKKLVGALSAEKCLVFSPLLR